MSNQPEELNDFENPNFSTGRFTPPSEGEPSEEHEPSGGERGPFFAPQSEGPSMEFPSEQSTGSVEIPTEPSAPFLQFSESPSAPSVEIPEEKEAAEKEEEQPTGPSVWQRLADQLDSYTVFLLLSLLAITVAVVLLGLELGAYQWDIGAKSVTGG